MVDDRGIEYVADNLGIGPENTKEQQTSPSPDAKTCKLAITSLVLGFLSLFGFAIAIIPAIILGVFALIKTFNSNGLLKGKGMAKTGIAIGIAVSVLYILAVTALGLLWF